MTTGPRMVFLGFGKFARADKIYALEPLRGDERGEGRRTRVWVEGMATPIVASRTERTILQDMGDEAAAQAPIVADALELARRLADAADAGRVDLGDLGVAPGGCSRPAPTPNKGDTPLCLRSRWTSRRRPTPTDGKHRWRFEMAGKVVHFEVPYDDVDRATSFYKDIFGWQIQSVPELSYHLVRPAQRAIRDRSSPGTSEAACSPVRPASRRR